MSRGGTLWSRLLSNQTLLKFVFLLTLICAITIIGLSACLLQTTCQYRWCEFIPVRQSSTTASKNVVNLEEDLICQSVLYGKDENFTKARTPDLTGDEEVLAELQASCQHFKDRYGFSINENPIYISKEEANYPIAYSILVHQQAHQLADLLSAIYAPQNVYCIHVDRKSDETFKQTVLEMTACLPNVFLSSKSESVVYASFSRLQADINCMDDLLNSSVSWKHLINMCGQDYPLYTNREIVLQLQLLNGRNAIYGHRPRRGELMRTNYVCRIVNVTTTEGKITQKIERTEQRKTPVPFNFIIYKNLAYNVYTRNFLQWALRDSEKAKALLEWSRDTLTPDEHYWRTLETVEEAPDKGQWGDKWQISRFVKWHASKQPCSGYWKHTSCVFGAGDISVFKNVHRFFANKFDMTFDSRPIRCLRMWLDQRKKRYDQRNPDKLPRLP